jgi:hypothetical protein
VLDRVLLDALAQVRFQCKSDSLGLRLPLHTVFLSVVMVVGVAKLS